MSSAIVFDSDNERYGVGVMRARLLGPYPLGEAKLQSKNTA